MLFKRKLLDYLLDWKERMNRKPLIIRGARQVGKSTLVKQFGETYRDFITINLEKREYKRIFTEIDGTKNILNAIFLQTGKKMTKGQTLLFIDEIQESPRAIQQLRYFYEDFPDLHVIAAGSLLEFSLGKIPSFPVGRVEQVVLHPLDFGEYLNAIGQSNLLEELVNVPVNNYAHSTLLAYFHDYAVIGGMPEIVQQYVMEDSMINLPTTYTNLWQSYRDDVEKYAKDSRERNLIRFIMQAAPNEKDRISFSSFTQSQYGSRQVREAFHALDLSRIVKLVYPTTNLQPPITLNTKRRPRLQFLDTGLLIHTLGLQGEMLAVKDMNQFSKGKIIQHLIAQELTAQHISPLYYPSFWVRENINSTAEVDMVYQTGKYLVPIEVKSGKQGRLRSLHQFVERSTHPFAVRLLNNQFSIETVTTPNGVEYQLMNLPYYLGSQLPKYIEWFVSNNNNDSNNRR